MKVHVTSPIQWSRLTKASMAIAAVCLAGQVMAQVTASASANGASTAVQRPANTSNDHAKRRHREVLPAPAKPPHYPSTPQPPVPTLR